jgi:hypothetical protein
MPPWGDAAQLDLIMKDLLVGGCPCCQARNVIFAAGKTYQEVYFVHSAYQWLIEHALLDVATNLKRLMELK